MPSLRKFRVRELLLREIGEILRRTLPVETSGLVNIHDVIMSADLRSATIFVGILGSVAQRKSTGALLHKLGPQIRGELGRNISLRYTPTLRFVMDDSIVEGDRVLAILEQMEKDLPKE
jgi:ribosome-binding factor A